MLVYGYPGCPAVIPQLAVTITRFIFGWDNPSNSEHIISEKGARSQRIQATMHPYHAVQFQSVSPVHISQALTRVLCTKIDHQKSHKKNLGDIYHTPTFPTAMDLSY